jgi:hypothetical protein
LIIKRPDIIERSTLHHQEHTSDIFSQYLEPLRIHIGLSSLFHQLVALESLDATQLHQLVFELESKHLRDPSPSSSYSASIMLDACVGKWIDQRNARTWEITDSSVQHITCYRSLGSSICCAHTLPDYFKLIHSATAAIDPLVGTPFAKMLGRAINPRKCRGKRFQAMLLKAIDSNHQVRNATDNMLLCSFLGNYPLCDPNTRPGIIMRSKLHCLFGATKVTPLSTDVSHASVVTRTKWHLHLRHVSDVFRRKLYSVSWMVVIFAYREYGIWVIDNHPALRDAYQKQFDYVGFRDMVIKVMNNLRNFMRRALMNDTMINDEEILREHTTTEGEGEVVFKEYEKGMDDIIQAEDNIKLVKTSIKTKKPGVLTVFLSYRNKLHPNALAWAKGTPVHMRLPNVETGASEYIRVTEFTRVNRQSLSKLLTSSSTATIITPDTLPTETAEAVIEEENDEKDREGRTSTKMPPSDSIITSLHFLTIPHTRVLEALMKRFPTTASQEDVARMLLRCMPAFGAPLMACKLMEEKVWNSGVGKADRMDAATELRNKFPYTYCVAMAAAVIWESHVLVKRYDLPHHYRKNQLEALTQRFGLSTFVEEKEPIPRSIAPELMSISICSICNEVYSLIRCFSTTPKRKWHANYRDKHVDAIKDICYCSRSSITWSSSCQSTPLARIQLLGAMLVIKKKIYMLCPQRACGMPMIYDPVHCAWTNRGPACSKCTEQIDQETEESIKADHSDYLGFTRACAACPSNKRLTRSQDIFLYGKDTYVCSRHHNLRLAEHVTATLPKLILESPHIPVDALIRATILAHKATFSQTGAMRRNARERLHKRKHRGAEHTRMGRHT